jgi:hypothetical protein
MRYLLSCLFGLFFWVVLPVGLRAQTPVDSLIPTMAQRPPVARWVIKFAPLSLFDVTNTIQFGVEHLQQRGRGAWQVEVGYGSGTFALYPLYKNGDRQRSLETWRGRAEYRLYEKSSQRWGGPSYRRPRGNYVAFEGFFKQVNNREAGSVGQGCEDGSCRYYQYYQTPVMTYNVGGHVKVGTQFWLSSNREGGHWLMDIYGGLGFRLIATERPGLPADGQQRYSQNYEVFDYQSGRSVIPSITMGLKLGFAL